MLLHPTLYSPSYQTAKITVTTTLSQVSTKYKGWYPPSYLMCLDREIPTSGCVYVRAPADLFIFQLAQTKAQTLSREA